MTFKQFLKHCQKTKFFGDSPESDFVNDTFRDKGFGEYETLSRLKNRVSFLRGCPEAIRAGTNVFIIWKFFKRDRFK